MTTFYVIEQDAYGYDKDGKYVPVGREYYTSSQSEAVDKADVRYAKFFPTLRSVHAAKQWALGITRVYEVLVEVKFVPTQQRSKK